MMSQILHQLSECDNLIKFDTFCHYIPSETIKNSKSPHHLRKKRLLAQAKSRTPSLKRKFASEKVVGNSGLIQNKAFQDDFSFPAISAMLSSECIEPSRKMFSNYRNLQRSNSYPDLSKMDSNPQASNCDFLFQKCYRTASVDCFDNASNVFDCSNSSNAVECDLSKFSTEFVIKCSDSRRSSASTMRERNNSVDSAFSQISIIDIKELEQDVSQVNVDSNPSNIGTYNSRSRSKSDACESLQSECDTFDSCEMFSLPSSFSENKEYVRKSIFEGRQLTVPTECFFPQPQEGQSLTSFLSSNDFNISAELDRENAHFCISEALISAIQQMKWVWTMKQQEKLEEESSEDEHFLLRNPCQRKYQQRIRIRRKEMPKGKMLKNIALLSDGKTDTATSQSASPPISSHSSEFDVDSIGSEDEVEDLELSAEQTESNLSSMKENGLSLSMASLYSDADIHKIPFPSRDNENKKFQDSESTNMSAESVALSLLRKFSEKHLPKASELQWLVSEQDAPQRLLPLPDSWPISPDAIEEEYNLEKTRLRGNLQWAPPRPQIIFSIHPNLKRKVIMEKQKYRCAGCGMKIEKNYVSRFRYCDYFGKYFCQCCHSNSTAVIPGRILWKWDFSKYYVSKFAWNLLDQMYSDPLFNIEDINKNLYQRVRQLELCRVYRTQLFYLKDFIKTCRKGELFQLTLDQRSHHIVHEPHQYSLSDLVQVKSGELSKELLQLIGHCLDHIKKCILCQAKGFICEICRKDKDIIFPFQLDRVVSCEKCGTCFHKKCFKNVACPRCVRIEERKKRLTEIKSDDEL